MKKLRVTKASGVKVFFSEHKLRKSLEKVGADDKLIDFIIAQVVTHAEDGLSTASIYRKAYALLNKTKQSIAARYKLKNAIIELGPTGYPFEQYVGAILRANHYDVSVSQIVTGRCLSHEVDVIAENSDHHFMVECKFHNRSGIKSDVKIPLYIHSRFLDIKAVWEKLPGHHTKLHQGWIVTNTRFTLDAEQYGECQGLHLVSWDGPPQKALKDMFEKTGLHPVTSLPGMSKKEKRVLIDHGVVLCNKLCEDPHILSELPLNNRSKDKILKTAHELCDYNP